MEDLLAEFVAEAREMLEAIEGEIIAWEASPGDSARLDAIFRFVHTIKGNCGFFDLPRLEALSHAAESALAEVRAGRRHADRPLVDAVLAVIDRIRDMVEAIDAGEAFPAGGDEALVAALEPDAEGDTPSGVLSAGTASDARSGGGASRSIRLPVELLDRVMASASDLVLARNELSHRIRGRTIDPVAGAAFERLSAMLDDLRDGVTRMRMQRIEHLFGAFPRLVRDLSAELGKQVMIDLEGGEVELDREMLEMIRDPLTHIIRNALDHGIEPPGERLAAGKREIGLLHIAARQSGNRIIVSVTDDGRGIDRERLVEKALASGVIRAEETASLDEAEQLALIFEAGLSTAEQVTPVSGRGVGMDVVRANIEQVGGSVSLTSERGKGTRILLSLPLTLSIVPALTVACGASSFAIARSYVEEIIRSHSDTIEFSEIGDACFVKLRGERMRCLALGAILEMDVPAAVQDSTLVLLRLAGGDLFALAVDRVVDHEELVIKPLPPAIMDCGLYSGTTLLDDGEPILMLDIAGIAREQGLVSDVRRRYRESDPAVASAQARDAQSALLVRALDGHKRLVRLDLVKRIERVAAAAVHQSEGKARVTIDGTILPLAGWTEAEHDVPEDISLLRLTDGCSEVAYAVAAILDTASISHELVTSEVPGEVAGVTLVEGEAVELLDGHWLFARNNGARHNQIQGTCRIDLSDGWVRSMLRPLLESAGYRVVPIDSEEPTDLAVLQAGGDLPTYASGRVIELVPDPLDAARAANRVFRYDRTGLLAAIARVAREDAA